MAFRAQYYSDPTDPDNVPVSSDKFQYFERKYIREDNGYWFYKEKKLNVFGAVDFAFSLNKKADYTAIVIIGVDSDNSIYVLDIDRFRTDRISEYFEHILHLSNKWSFRKLRAETMSIWHYRGGNIQILEEELSSRNPAHDDVIDALASVVDMAVKPARSIRRYNSNVVQFNKKFGGVSF